MNKECKKCRNSVAEVARRGRCYCPDPDDNSKCMLFKPMTNGDRVRAMTDEELTAVIVCPYDCDSDMCSNGTCFDCCMNWLQRPVKEDEI